MSLILIVESIFFLLISTRDATQRLDFSRINLRVIRRRRYNLKSIKNRESYKSYRIKVY